MVTKNMKSQSLGKGKIASAFGNMLKQIYGPDNVISLILTPI
jgi:hypothetical protein